jgi:hypothetical protein
VSAVAEPSSELAGDLSAFRVALADALADPTLDRWRGVRHSSTAERIRDHAALVGALHEDGWTRYGWPVEAGGLGGDVVHRAAFYDELVAAGLPIPDTHLMLETLGPPLVHFAPALAAELLPEYLTGREWWGQGFSEPEAGSDLASLRCRARRTDDGDYLLSGQKIWTTHGATAHRLVCLVRTGTPESRHRGLTMLMVDADAPGVSIRPIALASGEEELAEVFFDDVHVPAARLVGAEGGGWAVAMYLLQFERSMWAWQSATTALGHFREILGLVPEQHPDGMARRVGDVYADLVALRTRSAQTLRTLAVGGTVGPEAGVDKVLLARAETGLYDLVRDIRGGAFLFDDDPADVDRRAAWWFSRAATILGGSAEVQRTILADHVLGLPRETS